MMLTNILLTMLVTVSQTTPANAQDGFWGCWLRWSWTQRIICWSRSRRLQSADPQMIENELENTLATGEMLTQSPELWLETLEFLEENEIESRDDLERTIFEATQDESMGLLEEVVIVTAIWERLEEYVDTNNDGILKRREWRNVDKSAVPLPTTPDSFKATIKSKQSEGTAVVETFSHFFEAIAYGSLASEEEE